MSAPQPDRRRFISLCTKLVLGILGLLMAIPGFAYLCGPLRRNVNRASHAGADFSDAGALADFPIGEWRLHALEVVQVDGWKTTRVQHAIWVRRDGEGDQATVLSSVCPHLGCPINWHRNKRSLTVLAMVKSSTTAASIVRDHRRVPWTVWSLK